MPAQRRRSSRVIRCVALAIVLAGCGVDPASTPASSGPVPPATATPAVTPVGGAWDAGSSLFPDAEAALLHGMRLDLQDLCAPHREALPPGAVGAVTCVPSSEAAARVTVTLFETREAMLDAYQARLDTEGIALNTNGDCRPGQPLEGGYVPGPGPQERGVCWADPDGVAHYVATVPPFTLVGVDGRPGAEGPSVAQFAWLGNRDTPGGPTLWGEEPRSPEK